MVFEPPSLRLDDKKKMGHGWYPASEIRNPASGIQRADA